MKTWRRSGMIAWVICAASVALLGAGFLLAPHAGLTDALFGGTNAVTTSLSFLTYPVVGAFIITHTGGHLAGWLFCIAGLAWSLLSLSEAYVQYTRLADLGPLPAEDFFVWMSSWPEVVGVTAGAILVLYVFPTGEVLSPKWRHLMTATIAAAGIAIIASMLTPGPLEDYPSVVNPYGVGGRLGAFLTTWRDAAWFPLLLSLIAACVSVLIRFRRARGEERAQIKAMLLAGVVIVAYIVLFAVTAALRNDALAESLVGVAIAVIPAAAGVAILKYHLYDIDLVINRALVYGSLTGVLAAAYFGLVVTLQTLLTPVTKESDVAVAGSTLAVAAMFGPVRRRIQGFIDRRFYRSRYDAQQTLEKFSARLRDEVDLDHLTAELVTVVSNTVRPRHASLWLKGSS